MNNIATPNRIDDPPISLLHWLQDVRGRVATIALAIIWISFQPFNGAYDGEVESSLVNQIGYTSLCAITLALFLTTVDRRVFAALISPAWIVLFSALLLPLLFIDAEDSMRAVMYSLLAVMVAANFVTLPRNADELSQVFFSVCFLVLALCYGGLFVLPIDAIHQAGEHESQHSGLWRGLFTHKNIAGPVMVAITFIGVYLMRRGMIARGLIIALAAWFFIANTGSKTSFIVAPAVVAVVLIPSLMGLRGLAVFAAFTAMITTHALTIGTVFSPSLDGILRSVDPVTTFTGRIEIWEFAKPYLFQSPWTGYGYDGFWQSDFVAAGERAFDSAWDPRGIIHGHNGYLDFALVAGIPMMLVLIWVTILAPVIDYLRTPARRENVLLADLMFMIVVFAVMNAALESFFFRRADPVWLTLVVALFGLRLTSRIPLATR